MLFTNLKQEKWSIRNWVDHNIKGAVVYTHLCRLKVKERSTKLSPLENIFLAVAKKIV